MPYEAKQFDISSGLAAGIRDAGKTLGDDIDGMMQEIRQKKAMRQMAIDGLGMDADKVNNMSYGDLQGTLAGAALKQSNIGQQLIQQNQRQQIQLGQLNIARAMAESEARQRFAGSGGAPDPSMFRTSGSPNLGPGNPLASLAMGGEPPGSAAAPTDDAGGNSGGGTGLDINSLMQRGVNAGMGPEDLYKLAETGMDLQRGSYFKAKGDAENAPQNTDASKPYSQEIPGTDMVSVTYPDNKQAFMVAKSQANAKVQNLMNSDGSPAGQAMFDGKKWILNKDANSGAKFNGVFPRAKDDQGNVIPGLYYHPDTGAPVDMRSKNASDPMGKLTSALTAAGITPGATNSSPVIAPIPKAGPLFTDKTGAAWNYTGTGDPATDKDPANWQRQ